MATPTTPTRQTVLEILTLYGQGAVLFEILAQKQQENATLDDLLRWVAKYNLDTDWQVAKQVRATVQQATQDVQVSLGTARPQTLTFSGLPLDEKDRDLLARVEKMHLHDAVRTMLYRVSMCLAIFKASSLTISEAVAKIPGLTLVQYQQAVRQHPILHEAQQEAITHRKAIISDNLQFQKLQLSEQLHASLLEQTRDFETYKVKKESKTEGLYNLQGELIGEKKVSKEGSEQILNKSSAQTLKLAAEILGFNSEQTSIIPEGAVKLTVMTPTQLKEQQKEMEAKYADFLKQNPDYVE